MTISIKCEDKVDKWINVILDELELENQSEMSFLESTRNRNDQAQHLHASINKPSKEATKVNQFARMFELAQHLRKKNLQNVTTRVKRQTDEGLRSILRRVLGGGQGNRIGNRGQSRRNEVLRNRNRFQSRRNEIARNEVLNHPVCEMEEKEMKCNPDYPYRYINIDNIILL